MKVSGFMVPADKVATCEPKDTIKTAVDAMVEKKIGALVVLNESNRDKPLGIVTKSDLVEAYQKGITLDHTVDEIMMTLLQTIRDDSSKDQAAKALEHTQNHHAIVADGDGKFVGFISAWDITAECARDDRAWPWNRTEDGRIHRPVKDNTPSSPRSTLEQEGFHPPAAKRESHVFLDYIDSIRDLHEMDD